MNESLKHNAEGKKPQTTVYILFDSIMWNFKNRQNLSMAFEVRRVSVTWLFVYVCDGRAGQSSDKEGFGEGSGD